MWVLHRRNCHYSLNSTTSWFWKVCSLDFYFKHPWTAQRADSEFNFDTLLLVKSKCLKTFFLRQIFVAIVSICIGHNNCVLPHNLIRDMRIVQSNENVFPDAAKSLKPIMVSFDLFVGDYLVFVEEISPKTQTAGLAKHFLCSACLILEKRSTFARE